MNEGCWYGTDLVGQGHTEGIILHNGAVIAGLDDAAGATGQDTLMIDWDGAAGANTHANDQLVVKAIITNATSTDRVCSIRWDTAHTASGALWNQIFQ